MSFCQKCGKQLGDDMRFCDGCGAAVEAPVAAPVEAPVEMPAEVPAAPAQPKADFVGKVKGWFGVALAKCKEWCGIAVAFLKNLPKKVLMFGGAAVALVVVLAIVLGIVFSGGGAKVPSYALYVKNGDLYYNPDSSVKPWRVTKDPASTSEVQMSADGNRIFYYEVDGLERELRYRAVGKDKDSTKIDSDVSGYMINEKGTKVLYVKGGDLYLHDLKEKSKVASDANMLYATADLKTLLFSIEDGEDRTLYIKKGNKDKEKVMDLKDREVCGFTAKLDTVWFIDGEDLYKQKIGKDKEKLVSGVERVIHLYDSGEIFYVKTGEDKKVPLSTFVDDDLAASDAAAKEPVEPTAPTRPTYPDYPDYPDQPYWWEYDDEAQYEADYAEYETEYNRIKTEYEAAVQKYNDDYKKYEEDYEAYGEAYDKYRDEMNAYETIADRNEFRQELKETTYAYTTEKLAYFDGKKETVLAEDYTDYTTYADDKAVIVYGARKADESKKMKMSEIEYFYGAIYDVENFAENNASETLYVGIEGKAVALGGEDPYSIRLNEDGKSLYYLDNHDEEKNTAELYKVEIGKELKKAAKVDSDVDADSLSLADGKPVYTKDTKESHADLYWDGKKIDSDVYRYDYYEARGGFVYRTDYKDGEYTLKTSDGKNAVKVADDVHESTVLPNGNITYLKEYSSTKGKGDMYLYKGKKSVEVDTGVSSLVTVYGAQYTAKEYKIINW